MGGNGFIGSHIVDELIHKGHNIRVFDRGPEKWRAPLSEVEYFNGDFNDIESLNKALQGIDIVFHLISTTIPSLSNRDPVSDIKSNLENSVKLFQLMVEQDIKRIIYLSSGGTVYGTPTLVPIPETHSLNPVCSYGVVKVAIEKYLGMFESLYGLKALILRPSNPFGPRQSLQGAQGVIPIFMHKILKGETISIWGDGSVIRDYLYITDLSRICAQAVETTISGIFNLGSGEGKTLISVVKKIEKITKKTAKIEFMEPREFDVKEVVLDIKNIKQEFNWKPEISFEEGVNLHYDWINQTLKS